MMHPNHTAAARSRVFLAGLAALALASCATTPAPGTDGALVERAQARWDALLSKDFDAAYALYSPGYRSSHTRVDFEIQVRSKRIRYLSAAYRDHSCEGDLCTVNFDVEYQAPRPAPGLSAWTGKSVSHDAWIRSGGEWYFVPEK